MKSYTFKSARLGFRNWSDEDLNAIYAINQNDAVMEFFPAKYSKAQTLDFIRRMQKEFEEAGHCYFAVELLETSAFIGFIGLCRQTYEADFTPCVDIGWRLHPEYWGRGYATEGAQANLKYAFEVLDLDKVLSIASVVNTKSIAVMKKIGMEAIYTFDHPALQDDESLKQCWLYEKKQSKD